VLCSFQGRSECFHAHVPNSGYTPSLAHPHCATGEGWATLYDIQGKNEGKGHATTLLLAIKEYYERKGLRFGGSVALNERMRRLYQKCEIKEYG